MRCAKHHHKPFQAEEDNLLVHIVSYGNILSHMFGSGLADVKQFNPLGMVDILSHPGAGNQGTIRELVEEVKESFKHIDFE